MCKLPDNAMKAGACTLIEMLFIRASFVSKDVLTV